MRRTIHKRKLRQILWSMFAGAALVFGLYTVNAIAAPDAGADIMVCSYLDARPTVAGMEDLLGIGITINGWTPEYTGKFVANQIINNCPRHLIVMQEFINKWQYNGRYVHA